MPRFDRRTRNWVFTLNNPTAQDDNNLRTAYSRGKISYIVFQKERASTGTEHWQGYVELTNPTTLSGIKMILTRSRSHAIHVENRRGSGNQAREYAMKDDTRIDGPFESGTMRRSADLTTQIEMTKTHSIKEIMEANPVAYMRNFRGLERIKALNEKPRNHKPDIWIFYGPTGTGKTALARKLMKENKGYQITWPEGRGQWWFPGYDGEKMCLADEFSHQVPMRKMLQMLDSGPMKVQVKGGFRQFQGWKWIITTNHDPYDWYPGVGQNLLAPLWRRLKEFAKVWVFEELQRDEDDPDTIGVTRKLRKWVDPGGWRGQPEYTATVYDVVEFDEESDEDDE